MTVDMTKVTAGFIADNAAGTLQTWLEGYTDPDDEIVGQVRVRWVQDMTEKTPGLYVGRVVVEPVGRYGVDPMAAKEFRIAVKVSE